MKIKNNGERDITFSDLKIPACGTGQSILRVGKEALVYNEDAEKSTSLAALIAAETIEVISEAEPCDDTPVDDFDFAKRMTVTYAGAHSYQNMPADLTLDKDAGSADGGDPKYLAAIMGNVFSDAMTKDANYLGGVIGAYSITDAKVTTYPAGAVLAQITDGVTDADGAVVAYVDGDGDVTKANAAFKAMSNNSTSGSGFNFGLDLYGPAHDGYNELAILKADIRLSKQACIFVHAGVPADGTSGTGLNFAGPGSLCIDITNANVYVNANSAASPTWKLVTRAG